jgi:hypothetical protein
VRGARLAAAMLAAGLLLLGRATPARAATDSVLVRVGGDLSARIYDYIDVPITVELNGAPGRKLGSYTGQLAFNPRMLEFVEIQTGSFAAPQINTAHASDSGKVLLTALQPGGASGVVTLFVARFYVLSDTAATPVTVSFGEMSASATSVTPFESLLPLLKIVNGTFCRSLGRWGDVNGDGLSNSFDALVALSSVVGDSIDTTAVKPYLADVDADGKITSRDALIILSYGVGLPVPGYRVLLTAAGACGTGAAITLVVTPDSLELQAGQGVPVLISAHDASGRSVPVDSVSWASSNPSIAAFDLSSGQVRARAPGLATLTVQLGPGVTGRIKVSVLARRTTWYADVERARNAPTQTGTQAFPFEFIGEALDVAHDGDTVLIAGGTYEELVSGSVAVSLVGDPANRPVIDPRGSPNWYSYQWAIDIEPYEGRVALANLVVRAGKVYLDAHDFGVTNVLIQGLSGTYGFAALEMYSENLTPAGAPRPAGPMRSAGPMAPGNVLIDGVVVTADSITNGIVVDQADTAVIQNSSVTRTYAGTYPYCGAGPNSPSGIRIYQASVSLVRNNTVSNPQCQGIGVFDAGSQLASDVGRVTISRNHVTGAPSVGIGTGARLIALDHNTVRNTGVPGYRTYGYTAGVHVVEVYRAGNYLNPDSVVSIGDSILNSGGRGFGIDSALAAVVDSLVVGGTGQDSSGSAAGVELAAGGKFTLSHSHISNSIFSSGVYFTGDHTVLRSHGNHIVAAGQIGLATYQGCYSCAPPAGGGPALAGPERVGPYTGGPDTLISISDTILNSSQTGIYSSYGVYTLVDSAVVDSAGSAGIYLEYLGRATVSNSVARRSRTGIYSYAVDTLSVLRDTVNADTNGVYVDQPVDSVTIRGSVIDGNRGPGIYLNYLAHARIDSSVITNNLQGLYIYSTAGARVRWTRFQGNSIGMWLSYYANNKSSVVSSNFIGNTAAGARNDAYSAYPSSIDTLFAANNYWNDTAGPRCNSELTGVSCTGTTGDSIVTQGIIVLPFLTGPAPTPAPPALRPVYAAASMVQSASTASTPPVPPLRLEPASTFGTSAGTRPGAPVAAQAQTMTAVVPRSPHEQPPAWHAPSKARTHVMQGATKHQ